MTNESPGKPNQYDPQVLLNSQPVIVTVIDPDTHKAVFQNGVSLEKFGDISNQTCHEKIAGCLAPCEFCRMPEAVQSGRITSSEVPLPNEQYLLVQWSKAPTLDGRLHVVETITDISHVKQQQKRAEILNQKLDAANRELLVLNQHLRESSLRDGLTGLYNQSHFRDALQQGVAQFERSRAPLSLLFLDIDNFKTINDVYGHATGDQVLRAVGGLLDNRQSDQEGPQIWRVSDVTARYGGEEFAVLLPDTNLEGAVAFAERLRRHVMGLTRVRELADLPALSCSIGVATFPMDAATPMELLMAADRAMYAAKQAGKNCVKVSERNRSIVVSAAA